MKFGNHCAELQSLNENFSGTKGHRSWLPGKPWIGTQ
jgi:hypothetical protein